MRESLCPMRFGDSICPTCMLSVEVLEACVERPLGSSVLRVQLNGPWSIGTLCMSA